MSLSDLTLAGAFAAGFFSFASPCILPLLPSFLSYVTGVSIYDVPTDARWKVQRVRFLVHAVFFVVGFSAVFIALGAAATSVGRFLMAYREVLTKVGGVLIILMGLLIWGVFRPLSLNREWRLAFANRKVSKPAMSLLIGVGFGAGWSPCVGPFLGSVLVVAADAETVWKGIQLLGLYSLGLAVPFLAGAIALGWTTGFFAQIRSALLKIRVASGIFLVLVGTLVLTGYYQRVTQILVQMIGS